MILFWRCDSWNDAVIYIKNRLQHRWAGAAELGVQGQQNWLRSVGRCTLNILLVKALEYLKNYRNIFSLCNACTSNVSLLPPPLVNMIFISKTYIYTTKNDTNLKWGAVHNSLIMIKKILGHKYKTIHCKTKHYKIYR